MERLKVFLSSTQRDLQLERDSAEALVAAELGHECLRAETSDAPGNSPEGVCRDWARSCDIYVGIFGLNYGYKVPGLGVSATEMEYREARKADPGKVFIYVQEGEVLDADQKRFLEEVQSFSDGYFRHTRFASCGELKEQIRRDVITWTTQKVREALTKQIELRALRDKVEHMSRVMELYGIPEELR
jgi:hypothetical protein